MQEYIDPKPEVIRHILKDDGQFPNSGLFLLIYKEAIKLPDNDSSIFKKIFKNNNWENSWLNGIYDYHHYHSITHEVLGIYKGSANVQFGGPNGIAENVSKGDVIIIPAGVAHKCNSASEDFKCIGAYPDGMDYDIKKGEPSDRPKADENIENVKLPETDPVYGLDGPLILNWEMQ
ncbi:MAG: cupin domain-containing protein [Ginsengibacter sp.]